MILFEYVLCNKDEINDVLRTLEGGSTDVFSLTSLPNASYMKNHTIGCFNVPMCLNV